MTMDEPILILACSGKKLDAPAMAIDLYQGTLFKRGRAYAEKHNMPVLILSAKLGFIQPTLVIEPYNQRFTDTYRGRWPEGHGFYLGGQDYFGAAPQRFQPLIPSDKIGKMVMLMDQLDAIGRDAVFAGHGKMRGLQEAILDNLTRFMMTPAQLLAALVQEFGPMKTLEKTVKQALRQSGAAKAAGKTLHQQGEAYWIA